jgi:hypothetical protein
VCALLRWVEALRRGVSAEMLEEIEKLFKA